MNKKILILTNYKIFIDNDKISSDYNDTINIIEGLAKKNHLSFMKIHYMSNHLSLIMLPIYYPNLLIKLILQLYITLE